MFCMKCGNQIPDDSVTCPVCGAPVENTAPAAPVAPAAQYAPASAVIPSSTTYDIGGFVGDFGKNPIEACTSRDQSKHFLLGLTFPVFYLVMNFIFDLLADYVTVKSAIFNFLMIVVTWLNSKLLSALDYKVFSVSGALNTATMVFLAVVLYDYFYSKRTEKGSKMTALYFTVTSIAAWKLAETILSWMINKLFF